MLEPLLKKLWMKIVFGCVAATLGLAAWLLLAALSYCGLPVGR